MEHSAQPNEQKPAPGAICGLLAILVQPYGYALAYADASYQPGWNGMFRLAFWGIGTFASASLLIAMSHAREEQPEILRHIAACGLLLVLAFPVIASAIKSL